MFLMRMAHGSTFSALTMTFGRGEPKLSRGFKFMTQWLWFVWHPSVGDGGFMAWSAHFQAISQHYHWRTQRLDSVIAMVDGTIRRTSTPSWMQVAAYNGWKRVHGIKFQSLFFANGLIGHLWGPEMCTTGDSLMMHNAGTEQWMARVNAKAALDGRFYYL